METLQFLVQALQQLFNFVNSPQGRGTIAAARLLGSPTAQRQMKESTEFVFERFQEFVVFIQVKVDGRKKEAQVAVNIQKRYYASHIEGSTLAQGEYIHIVNNYNLHFYVNNFNKKDIDKLEKRIEELNQIDKSINYIKTVPFNNSSEILEQMRIYNETVSEISEEVKKIISHSTDYTTFQKALKTY